MRLLAFQDHGPAKASYPISRQPGPARNVPAIRLGCRLLNKMLGYKDITLSSLPGELLEFVLVRHGTMSLEELYEDVGTGKLPASSVVSNLLDILQVGRPYRQKVWQ